MIYRKNWIDYLLLSVYTGICVMVLAYLGYTFYVTHVGAPLAGLGMFLPFPVLFCLYPGIRFSSLAIRKRHTFSTHALAMTEAFAVSLSFVFGTLLRIREAVFRARLFESGADIEAGYYYDMATVKNMANTGIFRFPFRYYYDMPGNGPLTHGMSDLYVRCLRMVFSFLGNSVLAALLFQVILQLAAMLFAYLAIKKAAGRFAACTLLFLLAFSGPFIRRIDVVNPECLFLALFLAGLYLTISFVKGTLQGNGGFGSLPGAVLTGLLVGGLCYLELYCVILLLFLAGLLTGKSGGEGGRKRLAGRLLLAVAGCVAGFCGAVAIDALVSGISLYRGMLVWAEPYSHPVSLWPYKWAQDIGINTSTLFFVFLFLLASFGVFSFIRRGREQVFSLWFLPCILVSVAALIDFGVAGWSGGLTLFFWYVMASLGLQSAVLDGQAELMQARIEEINAAMESIDMTAGSIPPAVQPVDGASAQKPRFLENPLPVPKKHVKKEMDYDYPVAQEMMHFDLEPAEGDDFLL